MNEQDWSPEGVERLMRSMDSGLRKDPREVETEAAARREEQAKAERIAAALPDRLRDKEQFLKSNVPDHLIDARLARRRAAQGITEAPESRLPAQVAKDRVEERLRFARGQLARFGGERDVDAPALQAEWQRHVDSRNMSFRERVQYEAEAEGRQINGSDLSHEEAARNAHTMWSDGLRGPADDEIDRYIELGKKNGTWPPPELHTGNGGKQRPHPRIYSYERFKQDCADPGHHYNANAGHIGNSSVVDERAEKPVAPIRRLQSRQPPHIRREPLASSSAVPRTMRRDVNEPDGIPLHRGPLVPIQRLQSRQPPEFRMETAALAAEPPAAHRDVNGYESHALPVPGRQGLRDRLKNMLRPISQRIADRISRIVSGNRGYTASPPPAASVQAQPIGRRVEVIRSPGRQPMLIGHPVAYQADKRHVMTSDVSPTVRARDSGTSARASMIALRAAKPRSVNSL